MKKLESVLIMKDQQKYLRTYLKKLTDSLLYIKSLDDQLTIIKSWETRNRIEALNIGSRFFSLVAYSFYRTILIELSKLVSDREDRSIIDFLNKLKTHFNSLSPTKYNSDTYKRESIKPQVYEAIIDRHIRLIQSKKDIITKIKGYRDKIIAHSDKEYFSDPSAVLKKYHVENVEINQLLNSLTKILKVHHLYLLDTDVDIKVYSTSNVDSVLVYVRAFNRIWHDQTLNNLKKYIYKLDDYQSSSFS